MNSSPKSKQLILIQADSLTNKVGGIYQYTKNIVKNLDQNSFKLITQTKSNEFNPQNQLIIPKKKLTLYGTYRHSYLISKTIQQIPATHYWQTDHIFPLNLPKKLKKILSIHDLSSYLYPEFHTKLNYLGHKLFFKKSLHQADLILTPSKTVFDEVQANFKLNCRIETVYNGVNPEPEIIPPINRITEPFFLYVGTIEPRKNLNTLIQAYTNIQTQIPENLLLIGHPGWKSKEIHKLIQKHPKIIFLNHLPEPQKNYYIKTATALVYPSLYEGFGLPPLEAMQIGTPVVTSHTPALKELYKNHSLQFNPVNPLELSQLLINLSQNQSLRIELIKKGKLIANQLTWKKTATKIQQLISEV